jgi:tetratricopeptide (TPR) repeat protein
MTEAQALVERAISRLSQRASVHGLLAEVYDQQGEHEKALEQYRKTLELARTTACSASRWPSTTTPWARWKRPTTNWARLPGSRPGHRCQDASAHRLLRDDRARRRETDRPSRPHPPLVHELIEALEKAHPESGKPHTIHGDFLLRDGKFAEARDQFREALRTEKERFPIHMQLLQLDLQLRDYDALNMPMRKKPSASSPPYRSRTSTTASRSRTPQQARRSHRNTDHRSRCGGGQPASASAVLEQFGRRLQRRRSASRIPTRPTTRRSPWKPDNAGTLNNYAYYLSVRNDAAREGRAHEQAFTRDHPGLRHLHGHLCVDPIPHGQLRRCEGVDRESACSR